MKLLTLSSGAKPKAIACLDCGLMYFWVDPDEVKTLLMLHEKAENELPDCPTQFTASDIAMNNPAIIAQIGPMKHHKLRITWSVMWQQSQQECS